MGHNSHNPRRSPRQTFRCTKEGEFRKDSGKPSPLKYWTKQRPAGSSVSFNVLMISPHENVEQCIIILFTVLYTSLFENLAQPRQVVVDSWPVCLDADGLEQV